MRLRDCETASLRDSDPARPQVSPEMDASAVSEVFEADYEALRHGAGMIDPGCGLGRDVLRVMGSDALSYLQGQCTQDLTRLADGESADALLLSPQGKLDALVRITRIGAEELIIDVQAGYGEAVKERLERFKLRVKADVEPLPWSCVSIRGPKAREALGTAPVAGPTGTGSLVVDFEWNGVVGVDLLGVDLLGVDLVGADLVADAAVSTPADEIRVCGPDAWEAVRVEAGIPGMGSELDARTIPAEADLLERCVSTTKGCYTGQELVARLEARGNRVARRLRGLVVAPDSGVVAEGLSEVPRRIRGCRVVADGKSVGAVTSSVWSPSLGTVVGLGYVHRDVSAPGRVEIVVASPDEGELRVPAEVRDLPVA